MLYFWVLMAHWEEGRNKQIPFAILEFSLWASIYTHQDHRAPNCRIKQQTVQHALALPEDCVDALHDEDWRDVVSRNELTSTQARINQSSVKYSQHSNVKYIQKRE